MHQHADGGRVFAVRHLFAGQDLGQLFGAAGRVFGRDHPQTDVRMRAQRLFERGDGLRLIVFDADQRRFWLQQMAQNIGALQNFFRALAHQAVVGGDIGFALGGVEDQRFHAVSAALQLTGGGEAGAAQPGDAGLMNALNQFVRRQLAEVGRRLTFTPAVFAVGADNHAQFGQAGRVSGDMRFDGDHRTGGRRMHRQRTAAAHGQRLAFQYAVAGLHQQFAFRPQVLLQRNNKGIGQRGGAQRGAAGLRLHFRWMDPAVEIPNAIFFKGGEQIKHVAPRE